MDYLQYKRLTFARSDSGVLTVTLNRPAKLNAADEVMQRELADVWTDISSDEETRAVVVTGAGKAFSAGGDLDMVERMAGDRERVSTMLGEMSDLVYNLPSCSKPVVSAINGVAVGAGLVVALLADVSVCADDARLGDGHIKLGVAAGDHAALIWPQLIGMAKARYYLLTGEMLTGSEAERLGMVSKTAPADSVVDEATQIAEKLANGPAEAIRLTRRAINNWLTVSRPIFDQAAAYEMLGFLGPDVHEGVRALKEKRAPAFGRDRPHDAGG